MAKSVRLSFGVSLLIVLAGSIGPAVCLKTAYAAGDQPSAASATNSQTYSASPAVPPSGSTRVVDDAASPAAHTLIDHAGATRQASAAHDKSGSESQLTSGQIAYDHSSIRAEANPLNWTIDAYKSRHRLEVYYEGHLYASYPAVFGRSPLAGGKLWQGDRRTPEGTYLIVAKHKSRRWQRFLALNYPNGNDQRRYREFRKRGLIPVVGGVPAPEGGNIGIHGTDVPVLNRADIDWTTGCISVEPRVIEELYRLLPVGTLVIIKP